MWQAAIIDEKGGATGEDVEGEEADFGGGYGGYKGLWRWE